MSDASTATERPIPWLIGVAALLWLTFNCTRGHEMPPAAKPAPQAAPAQPASATPAPAADTAPTTEPAAATAK